MRRNGPNGDGGGKPSKLRASSIAPRVRGTEQTEAESILPPVRGNAMGKAVKADHTLFKAGPPSKSSVSRDAGGSGLRAGRVFTKPDVPPKRSTSFVPVPDTRSKSVPPRTLAVAAPKEKTEFDNWDVMQSHHQASRRAAKPLLEKWRTRPDASKPSKVLVEDAVSHMEAQGRLFSHELPRQYIPHAISQGGVQSGFNTSLALGLAEPKHDKGSAAANFVFTRQLPPLAKHGEKGIPTRLNQGQVGATTDAMLVFKPSAFADREQPVFFKTIDGAHHSTSILPERTRKGDHMKALSDQIAESRSTVLHANQEQGLYGSVPLRHLAAIVLKTDAQPDDTERLRAAESEFIGKLKTTFVSELLPPPHVRKTIKEAPDVMAGRSRLDAFRRENAGTSLHDELRAQINAGGGRPRSVSELVVAVPSGTERRKLPGIIKRREPSGTE